MKPDGWGVMPWVVFYGLTLLLTGLLAALFEPAAAVLKATAQRHAQGPSVLIPLAFLLISFLFAFIRARREAKRRRWVPAYGWLLGSSALSILLLYLYLSRQVAG